MKYETQVRVLGRAYEAMLQGDRDRARQISMPVIGEMNRQIYTATRYASLDRLGYKRHYLTLDKYLSVLRAQGFDRTSLDSVTAISWNKMFGDDESYTLVGALVRHGKRYGHNDQQADPRAIRALAYLAGLLAHKMSRPRDRRLIVYAPSTMKSTNNLPSQISELITIASNRYDLAHPETLTRCREVGSMKDVSDFDEKLRLIKGSMKAQRELVRGRQVLLIDDLLDAGGTLRESARALKVAGATEVHAVAMVKTRSYVKETMCKP